MTFNDKEVTESNKMKYRQYFIYLQELIKSKPNIEDKHIDIEINDIIFPISSVICVDYTKHVIDNLLNNILYSRVDVDIHLLSISLNDDVDDYDTFIRKSIINELL